jgi:hypothetical protein
METAGDILRKAFNDALFLPSRILVPKPRQHMLLMQLIKPGRFLRDLPQQARHFVLNIYPPRRKQVHLDNRIAIIFEPSSAGDEAPALFG